ncbi:MAG: CorA family divalent cation transporter [Erysipelotrichaceae bacterium]|nr:CorA family divalent cation transporter [Erysipelotrichaceae bacterium]
MKCYLIQETLTECSIEDIKKREYQYCAIVTPDEYRSLTDVFHMGIDIEMDLKQICETKAVVNYDSLTGTFNIPDHDNYSGQKKQLAFALDERGIVFVDEDDYAESVIRNIQASKKWKLPSLERLLYDFLEETIKNDMTLLEMLEENLSGIENGIMCGDIEEYPIQLNDIRYELLDLQKHYEHLIDLSQELEENENEFFYEDNLRYFKLFTERVNRLQDTVIQLREFIVQLRDLVSEQLSIRQNKIVTLLTVITTIFMPLTLIVGWYGMNFIYMPELRSPYGYPGVILVSVLIVVILLYWFKKKRWM